MTADRRTRPNVFSIPAGAPFLPTLADALLSGRLVRFDRSDPLALADVTILLPTRRSVRVLRDLLAARIGSDAAILPAMRPIGDADEEEHLLAADSVLAGDRLVLPPALTPLARQLTLTGLTLAWGRTVRRELLRLGPDEEMVVPASPADAARLAADLARLMDDMTIAGIGHDAIERLAPDDLTGYFRITLDFLKIASRAWPDHLREHDRVDPTARRDALIRADAGRMPGRRGATVAAGSTGSIAATAALLTAIARAPNGAVVLPGLDTDLDEAAWSRVGSDDIRGWGHPQAALKGLIERIGIARADVAILGAVTPLLAHRGRLVSEALRPAETTDAWSSFQGEYLSTEVLDAGLTGVTLVLARNEQEEALAIALAFREAIERGVATAALVTPDRALARRVAAELTRWNLEIDDSAGAPLSALPEGVFARLLVETVFGGADPVALLALLKHPLAAFGMPRPACRRGARALELALFRGSSVVGGIGAVPAALAAARAEAEDKDRRHPPEAQRHLWPEDWDRAARLADALARLLTPLEAVVDSGAEISARELSGLLSAALTDAANSGEGDERLWSGSAGIALTKLLDGIAENGDMTMLPAEFPAFLDALLAGVQVPRPPGADPRIHIWGTLEARLQSADLVILGGLDEGVWPAAQHADPFLSRTMRAEVGLPPPERRIGQAAHDFAILMAAPQVIATRALKRGGAPTVESRWLQRLAALIGRESWERLKRRGETWLDLARRVDLPETIASVDRPEPKPPVAVRPKRLSITEIETLIRDPYAIYARHILRLRPLEPLGQAPDYATRGTIVHEALGLFSAEWNGPFDAAAEARLRAIGAGLLAEIAAYPDVHALWSARFDAIARWFVAWERLRAGSVEARHAEIRGELLLPLADGTVFTLSGRADRIDLLRDGTLAIYDFKTGSPPSSERSVFAGLTPQLTLEAAMARAGAFGPHLAGRSVADLAWFGLGKAGRGEPYQSAVLDKQSPDDAADRAMVMFRDLIEAFALEATPYRSRARAMMVDNRRFTGDYDHLARVREWSLVESREDELAGAPP